MPVKAQNCDDLKTLIREVPDFPKSGILFYDITTLLKDRKGFARLIDEILLRMEAESAYGRKLAVLKNALSSALLTGEVRATQVEVAA